MGPKWSMIDSFIIYDQFGIIQNLQMSPISKISQDQFLGLDFSYSKTTLTDLTRLQPGGQIMPKQITTCPPWFSDLSYGSDNGSMIKKLLRSKDIQLVIFL